MKLTFYYDDISPCVRSVLFLCEALKIDMEMIKFDIMKNEHLKDDFVKMTIVHTVPTLIVDNDLVFTESGAIMMFLCEKFDKNKTFFHFMDMDKKYKIMNRLFFYNGFLFRYYADLMDCFFHKKTDMISFYMNKIDELYMFIDKFLTKTTFIATDDVTIADFGFMSILTTLFLVVPLNKDKYMHLFNWFTKMKTLPYYEKANERGLMRMRDILKGFNMVQIY